MKVSVAARWAARRLRQPNLVFDGKFLYQYDGFNRLVQVNAGTDLDVNDFAATGRLVDPNSAPVGVQLAAFIYDGLGRLIRTVRQDANDEDNSGTRRVAGGR